MQAGSIGPRRVRLTSLEPILKRTRLLKSDESTSELDERKIVGSFSFPANEKSAEPIMPGVRALHDPAPRPPFDAAEERRFSPTTNMWSDAAHADLDLRIEIVVPLVQA